MHEQSEIHPKYMLKCHKGPTSKANSQKKHNPYKKFDKN